MKVTVEYDNTECLAPMVMLVEFLSAVTGRMPNPQEWTLAPQAKGEEGDYRLININHPEDHIKVGWDCEELCGDFDYHGAEEYFRPSTLDIKSSVKFLKTTIRKMKKNAKMYMFAGEMRKYLKTGVPDEWEIIQEDDDGEDGNTITLESARESVTLVRDGTDLSLVKMVGKKEQTVFQTSLYDAEAHKQVADFLSDIRGNQVLYKIYNLLMRHCDTESQVALVSDLKALVPKPAVRSHISKLVNDFKRLKNGKRKD